MNKYLHKYLLRLVLAGMMAVAVPLLGGGTARAEGFSGRVVVFTVPPRSTALEAVAGESVLSINSVFERLGRFRPVEYNRLLAAVEKADKMGISDEKYYETVASLLKADLYVLVTLSQVSNRTIADLRVRALNPACSPLRRNTRLVSRIMKNVSLKLGREIAHLHRGLPLKAPVLKRVQGDVWIIGAGQWSGLEKGFYGTKEAGRIEILETGRFQSVARIPGASLRRGEAITFALYPREEALIAEQERQISRNAEFAYGVGPTLLRGGDAEKQFVSSICIINMGGNVCLPGYGAFLSTSYMGFENPSPDVPGIVFSASVVGMQLGLPSVMNRFKINPLPWVRDNDKSARTQDLQIFLWSTLPVTFTAAYLDQLAHQFHKTEHLPPFFDDRDNMAGVLSLFIPGGGLFYKGRRLAGWGYFVSEMSLAGYGVYNRDETRGKYAFAALGVIKVIDILNAYWVGPAYSFYNLEMEREFRGASFSVGMHRFDDRENTYRAGFVFRF